MSLPVALAVVLLAVAAAVGAMLAVHRRLGTPLLADPGRGSPTISLRRVGRPALAGERSRVRRVGRRTGFVGVRLGRIDRGADLRRWR